MFSIFGVQWVLFESVRGTLLGRRDSFVDRRRIKVWRAAPYIFWTIWKERKRRYFALSDLNGDKAPGPDGFSLSFWQFSWDFVKDEVIGGVFSSKRLC